MTGTQDLSFLNGQRRIELEALWISSTLTSDVPLGLTLWGTQPGMILLLLEARNWRFSQGDVQGSQGPPELDAIIR